MTQSITKQVWEIIPLSVDFAENLADGEAVILESSEVKAYDSTGQDVSDLLIKENSIIVVANTQLQAAITDGEQNQKYKVSFRAYINETKQLEEDVFIKVKD